MVSNTEVSIASDVSTSDLAVVAYTSADCTSASVASLSADVATVVSNTDVSIASAVSTSDLAVVA